jgi:hypothetical protein
MHPKFSARRFPTGWVGQLGWLWLFTVLWRMEAQVKPPRLEILPPQTNGWIRLSSLAQSNTVLSLDAANRLGGWRTVGVFHDGLAGYPEFLDAGQAARFYRLRAGGRGPGDDWKNQIAFPDEPFRSVTNSLTEIGWVKFAILLDDPGRVYYQDSHKYKFHYDFATRRLAPFAGMNYADFDRVSMHRAQQQVAVGTVFYPPGVDVLSGWMGRLVDCGIQFDGVDPYPVEDVARWFERVKATVAASSNVVFHYMPAFEQIGAARAQAEALAARGIGISSPDMWTTVNDCYSPGWALGRLKFFPATEIAAAFSDGRLKPDDILLTDGVPADAPIVAGIVTLTPATPNSHTALLAQSLGAPFVYLPSAAERARAQALNGRRVLLSVSPTPGAGQMKLIDAEGLLTPAFESELLALKQPNKIDYAPKKRYGAYWASANGLTPRDSQYFGGKASNYGLLRRQIPSHCPVAVAFSFDLWDSFMEQTMPGGGILRSEIAGHLAPFEASTSDIAALKASLAAVRKRIEQTASFSAVQRQQITNALSGFNPSRPLRFRSSTNVEDTERFTGAGLYDSYSGCLLDEWDGDGEGPCHCDPEEPKERGVFRALQKVYASFYNDDAFLARRLYHVVETEAAMGVLAHPSFPDAEELANGVATVRSVFQSGALTLDGDMVTQKGAESVTNPEGGSIPEVVHFNGYPGFILKLKQGSSLMPLGAWVMEGEGDYRSFATLFATVAQGFREFYPSKSIINLDFEYKKDALLGLVVKQVRQLPQTASAKPVTAILIDDPAIFQLAQYGSVFANHRLKSQWTLHARNLRLAASNLVEGVYAQSTLEYLADAGPQTLQGPMTSWPGASNSPAGDLNCWTTGEGASRREWQLKTTIKTNVSGAQPPIVTLLDFPMQVTVAYATPQPVVNWSVATNVASETVRLQLRNDDISFAIRQDRMFVLTNRVSIQTTYYWPKPPEGIFTIMTPLQRFDETRITGLTAQPIVLRDYYSQSYGAFVHNYAEDYLFEPRLEPGLPASTLAELEAANIRFIYVSSWGGGAGAFWVGGLDGEFRRL